MGGESYLSLPLMPDDWKNLLDPESHSAILEDINSFLSEEIQKGKEIYPPLSSIYRALELCPVDKVKAVILGQDPYHGEGQAHGLAFSVNKGIPLPPSLVNIFKERESDLGIVPSSHGDLTSWAKEGVLLLNATLTVEKSQAASHQKKGWEIITKALLHGLAKRREGIAFILWGASAQKTAKGIDEKNHFLLTSPHPSPLSSYRGFFGSAPFSKVNKYLESRNENPINWENT